MLRNLDKFSLPEIEEKVLKFWHENQIFQKSLTKGKKNKPFVFYEGPPSANARPGIHHVLARVFKDIILRFKTMQGFYVERRAGWDTHGLPIEVQTEKSLGFKNKQDIERYGIAKFNQKCKELVWLYKDEWEKLTDRIGFWLDLKNPYITYENSYIETLWWLIAEIWKKKLLYKGHKVVPWCTRCGTALSSHELALGYKEVEENSVYVKFKLNKQSAKRLTLGDKPVYILSWTTTPWTLPGNVALVVKKDIKYSMLLIEGEVFVLAFDLIIKNFGNENPLNFYGKPLKGEDLIGLEYEPLFDVKTLRHSSGQSAYKVYPADFVTTEDGTGVVHTAVMYGEDDYNLGKKFDLPQHHTVNEQGKFTKDVAGLAGNFVKAKETEEKIIKTLEQNGNLLKTEKYTHDYPFCWRCDTPLLYYARDSWFIAMSKLRSKLLAENKKIHWVPESIKDGRFGEWLREVKDWAFSRERYWGTPLPIWECNKCHREEVINGREKLSKKLGKANNNYILMRHAEAESLVKNVINNNPKELNKYPLTLKGQTQAEKVAKRLNKNRIDLIFSSDFIRTRETAEIVAKTKGIKVIFDERLRELNTGIFDGGPSEKYHDFFNSTLDKFFKKPPEGESLTDVGKRVFSFISDVEKKHKNKNILIVSHETTTWLLETVMSGWSEKESAAKKETYSTDFIKPAEFRPVEFLLLPRNDNGFVDLHRPYVDEVIFACEKCGEKMKRVPEVADVWFDSGAMPFAQNHYPFEKSGGRRMNFPADYITEGIDQTRGWFYTLLAVSTLIGRGAPYKNVISLGLVLDKNGQKMSKSKGNVIDPWLTIQKYGVDSLRWYFFTVNPPGEPKKFDEGDLGKVLRQFISLTYNSLVFFNTYGTPALLRKGKPSPNILDKWINARLNQTVLEVTKKIESYEVVEATKNIENFVQDLSRWYIRRSRRRFQKGENPKDYAAASQTLNLALLTLSKLLAPFTPFFAEAVYKSLHTDKHSSVHLESWPKAVKNNSDKKLIDLMNEVRRLASVALAKRAELGIKVRQPLGILKIKNKNLAKEKQLLEILKDEVNVKKVIFDPKIKENVWLDSAITHELREEGWLRELTRVIQDLRQEAKLEPKDKIILSAELPEELSHVFKKNEDFLKKEVNAVILEYRRSNKFDIEIDTKLDEWSFWLALRKKK
ncbi:MAG: class I tRNA ligase family protein [Patescibacteria group bacterium]